MPYITSAMINRRNKSERSVLIAPNIIPAMLILRPGCFFTKAMIPVIIAGIPATNPKNGVKILITPSDTETIESHPFCNGDSDVGAWVGDGLVILLFYQTIKKATLRWLSVKAIGNYSLRWLLWPPLALSSVDCAAAPFLPA